MPVSQIASGLENTFLSVTKILVVEGIILIAGFSALSIFLSHRIAGPVYRFEKSVRAISSGDLSFQIKLRKTDELKDLADDINKMIGNLRSMVEEDKKIIKEVISVSDEIQGLVEKDNISKQALQKTRNKLNLVTKELNKTISRYKT